CGDPLRTDAHHNLSEKTIDADADDMAYKLIASADFTIAFPGILNRFALVAREAWLERGFGDAMVSAWSLYSFELAVKYPLLDGGIADAQYVCGFARSQQRNAGRHSIHCRPAPASWRQAAVAI